MGGLLSNRAPVGMGWTSRAPLEPAAGSWGPVPAPDPRKWVLSPPPANDSAVTRAELNQLKEMAANRSAADLARVRRWSTDEKSVVTHWTAMADRMAADYRLSPPAGARLHALLAVAIDSALVACWHNKYLYRRPRPSQLDPALTTAIPVPEHPSYPSGHASAAGAAARILEHFFPQDAARFLAMALDSGLGRMQAGIHYRSDITAGLTLGRQIADEILQLEALNGTPVRYRR